MLTAFIGVTWTVLVLAALTLMTVVINLMRFPRPVIVPAAGFIGMIDCFDGYLAGRRVIVRVLMTGMPAATDDAVNQHRRRRQQGNSGRKHDLASFVNTALRYQYRKVSRKSERSFLELIRAHHVAFHRLLVATIGPIHITGRTTSGRGARHPLGSRPHRASRH